MLKQQKNVAALAAAVGATLFMVSDTALAANKFRTPFRSAELLILGTYYTAIWLIALSVAAGGTTLSAASST